MSLDFICPACHSACPAAQAPYRCDACGQALDNQQGPISFPLATIATRPPDMWRYREALPVLGPPVSLGEIRTPLTPFNLDGMEVLAKGEYALPTGSYKDRGAALLMTHLRDLGVAEAVEDSSGNAGASMAAYAARAGLRLKVFCPASAAAGKLAQIRLYGAALVPVKGPRPRATEALLEYIDANPSVYASHLWHPLFIDGLKTLAYEIAEQLNWTAPDAVACPVGAGSILLGLYRGFEDLRRAGIIARLPRLIAVQAKNVSPLYKSFHAGADEVAPATAPQPTRAEGIALPRPVRDREIIAALHQSGGTVVAVSEDSIAHGLKHLGRAGFCVEPTSAVVWDGLTQARTTGLIEPGQKVVAVLSGHGLKASQDLVELLDE
ncbi:MAG: pyridoxal-phosphate dependent enzyme [Candidatus Latescibacteria bacterium]|nr:pyridoxal-phosphate dependent enzyme [Candidatus Latescibacterota bacterium]